MDLDEPVDDDLTVTEMHAGVHDDRPADAHLRSSHREAMRDAREHGNSQGFETRLRAVKRQREERVSRPRETHGLEDGVGAPAEFRAVPVSGRRELRIGDERREEGRAMLRLAKPVE